MSHVGDWEREDASFCHPCSGAAAEERREAEEDAGNDVTSGLSSLLDGLFVWGAEFLQFHDGLGAGKYIGYSYTPAGCCFIITKNDTQSNQVAHSGRRPLSAHLPSC